MNILFATDGSENSDGAAKFVSGLPFSQNDRISALHVINWTPVLSEWETVYPDFRMIRDEIVPKILESAEKDLKDSGAVIDSSYAEGDPDSAIIDEAVKRDAGLIVMGSSGMSGMASHLIGSVTRTVAIKANSPVLIIKQPQWERSAKLKILYATDGSVYSEAVADTLLSIPFPEDTEICVLHTISPVLSDIPDRFAIEMSDRIKKLVADEREREYKETDAIFEKARAGLGSRFSSVESIVKLGNPSEEILEVAKSIDADIIALGSSGMRGIKGMLGSISRYVVNHCACSVLIGKAPSA